MKGTVLDIVLLLVLASLAVLIVTHPDGFAKDVSSVGGYAIAQTTLFTGGTPNFKG